jgi:hypothetical protein
MDEAITDLNQMASSTDESELNGLDRILLRLAGTEEADLEKASKSNPCCMDHALLKLSSDQPHVCRSFPVSSLL